MSTPDKTKVIDAIFTGQVLDQDRFGWQPGDVEELDPSAKPEGWDDLPFKPFGADTDDDAA